MEQAARSLAAMSLAEPSAATVVGRTVGRGQSHGTATVLIDCGTAETASLVRQIDSHAGLDSVVDGTVTTDSDTSPAWVEFRPPSGEPLDCLVDRLGSPPPPVLGEAWKSQLAELKEQLRAARLPLHHALPEDLRVDKSARLHIAFLSLRIAASICQVEPRCRERGSLALWFEADRAIDLSGIDRHAEMIASVAGSQPVAAVSSRGVSGNPAAARPSHDSRPGGGEGARRRPPPGRAWIWAGGLAALVAIAATAFWWHRPGESPAGEPEPRKISQATHTSTAEPTSTADPQPAETAAESERSLSQLSRLAGENAAGSKNGWEADLAAVDFDAFAEPAIDLAGEGFEATGEHPAEGGEAEGNPERTAPSTSDIRSAAEAGEQMAVDLPPRDQTAAVPLPNVPEVDRRGWAAAELQMPAGETAWKWIDGKAISDSESEPSDQRRLVGIRGADGIEQAVAVLNLSGSGGGASLAWTARAAELPAAEQLRNGRLRIGDWTVYLRTLTESDSVRLEFAQSRQEDQWSLAVQPDPRRSRTSISAVNGSEEEGAGDPLFVRWLQAVQESPDRSVRALAEIREEEESPVAVRVRFDVQRGRRIELETRSVATIEPTIGWQPASRDAVTAAQDRAGVQRQEIQRMLEVIRQRYSIADNRQLKRELRRRREALEHQQETIDEWTRRLGALQVMLARISSELEWRIEVHTEWPDARQRIFASGDA